MTDEEKVRAKKVEEAASFGSCGAGRFLKYPEGKVEIDDDRVEEDAKRDGLRGIVARGCGEDDPR